jgi:hypothetical protein
MTIGKLANPAAGFSLLGIKLNLLTRKKTIRSNTRLLGMTNYKLFLLTGKLMDYVSVDG